MGLIKQAALCIAWLCVSAVTLAVGAEEPGTSALNPLLPGQAVPESHQSFVAELAAAAERDWVIATRFMDHGGVVGVWAASQYVEKYSGKTIRSDGIRTTAGVDRAEEALQWLTDHPDAGRCMHPDPNDVGAFECGDWLTHVPRHDSGTFFVGISYPAPGEAGARLDARQNVVDQIVEFLGLCTTTSGDSVQVSHCADLSASDVPCLTYLARCTQERRVGIDIEYSAYALGFVPGDALEALSSLASERLQKEGE